MTCASTYISVSGTSLACGAGDSGGPWFASQTAFGVHNGGASSGTAPGQCARAIYMSTDRISDMGLSLFYGS